MKDRVASLALKDKPGGSLGNLVPHRNSLNSLLSILENDFGYDSCHNKLFREFVGQRLVADLGCGHGYSSFYLSIGAKNVVGFDIDLQAINYARSLSQRLKSKQVEFHAFDGYNTNFPSNHFDVVVSSDVIEHVHEPILYLKEAYRICSPGGMLLLSTPNGQLAKADAYIIRSHSIYHVIEYTPLELQQMIESSGFKINAFFRQFKIRTNPRFINRFIMILLQVRNRLFKVKTAQLINSIMHRIKRKIPMTEDITSYNLSKCSIADITPNNCEAIIVISHKD